MNKILVEVSVGELMDKISILEIKKDRIKDSDKLKFINDEYEILKSELEKNIKIDEKLAKFFVALKNVNSKLWIIEDDKRKCENDTNFGEDFIRLSRDVHFLNDTRAKIKLDINNHTGSKIKEIKEYTSY
ncbi:DUF6165 family protein [Candidatus Pelagibacter sp.]|nr:DUF6165 family protein [Candidatus Pelagibacter sp.]